MVECLNAVTIPSVRPTVIFTRASRKAAARVQHSWNARGYLFVMVRKTRPFLGIARRDLRATVELPTPTDAELLAEHDAR